MSRNRVAVLSFVAPAVFVACALPLSTPRATRQTELLVGYVAESASGGSVRRVVPGVDVRLVPGRSGVTVGWSDLRWLQGTPEAGRPACRDGWAWPLGWAWCDDRGARHRAGLLIHRREVRPGSHFTHHLSLGADLHASRSSAGVGVGLSSSTRLGLRPGASALVAICYASGSPLEGRMIEEMGAFDGCR